MTRFQTGQIRFHEQLSKLLADRGRGSAKQIASEVKISTGTLSQYAKGQIKPSFEVLVALAAAFGVTLDQLVFGAEASVRADISIQPWERSLDLRLSRIQQRVDAQAQLSAKLGGLLAERISSVVKELTLNNPFLPGMLVDDDSLVLEEFSVLTQLVVMRLDYGAIQIPGTNEAAAGRFISVMAKNAGRGRSYEFLLPKSKDRDWKPEVLAYKKVFLNACGGDRRVASAIRFHQIDTPVAVGFVLYHLDVEELKRDQPFLFAQVESFITDDGWLGYVHPSSLMFQGNALLDKDLVGHARHVFAMLQKAPKQSLG